MSDNRLTIRPSLILMSEIDQMRSSLLMSRPEFVRYCVQSQIASMRFEAEKVNNDMVEQIRLLKVEQRALREENKRLIDYIS